jgi:pilus assembly protein Flp/PilA
MKSLARKVWHFLVADDGPTAVEYAIMLGLIAIVCLSAISVVGTMSSSKFTTVANSVGGATGS